MFEATTDFIPEPGKDFVFRCYGVAVAVRCSNADLMSEAATRIRAALLDRIEIIGNISDLSASHWFTIGYDDGYYTYSGFGSEGARNISKSVMLNFLESMVRLTIAEYAVDTVFIHSGVVAWNGKALLIPGNSYSGKSTLVAELVKNGAVYYSDEYAVLDGDGLVHPFPRPLGMRETGDYSQTDVSVETLCGTVGEEPLPIGMVLITEYRDDAYWEPETLDRGDGILEIIPHTISIRVNTKFALSVLNKVLSSAIVIKGQRPDVGDFAKILSNFVDNRLNYVKMA